MAALLFDNTLRKILKRVAIEVGKAEKRLSSTDLANISEDIKASIFCKYFFSSLLNFWYLNSNVLSFVIVLFYFVSEGYFSYNIFII